MESKINIDVEKMIELEKHPKDKTLLTDKSHEFIYWLMSLQMPFEEIKQDLIEYDNPSLTIDEQDFISYLRIKYEQPKDRILLRIEQVRKIMEYEKELEENDQVKIK
ncbi:MAG: hypothetical protein E7174_02525 [Firmicutes bacterium]|nr:hypothetical protein [Bacillota bacterium]